MRAALAIAAVLAACSSPSPPASGPGATATAPVSAGALRATVRRTADGVPHVRAADWAGLGFGQGWAVARLHLCVLADQIVRVRSERARSLGAGDRNANLDSDFFHLHLGYRERALAVLPTLPAEARDLIRGYAAGYSHYVARTPPAQWPAPCRGAAWVRAIDDVDVVAHSLALSSIASSRAFEALIGNAAPRPAEATRAPLPALGPRASALASNGWALGADRTAHGGGLVVANPHFPWQGELMFSQSHLTIPGQLDVYGAGLVGVPLVNIGFNQRVAWTHTFSSSVRFVIYRLTLVPGQPLRWKHGDDIRPIMPVRYTVDVRDPDGTLRPVERTLYRTQLGAMLDSAELPWDPAAGTAYALRDVAPGDGQGFATYLDLVRAGDVADVERALARSGTPFVNTIAADAAGDVLYLDGSRVPALRGDALLAWQLGRRAIPALDAAWKQGVAVLDGSRPMFDLVSDDPLAPGAIPIADAPRLRRRDVVINANDSYRFTHPTVAMAAASPLYGDASAPSPRTLMNLRHVAADSPDAGPDHRFDRREAAAAMLSNRSYTALAMRDEVVARCRSTAPTPTSARPARARAGFRPPPGGRPLCEILARWDGRFAVDSRGAALWRELMVELAAADGELPWARAYDPAVAGTPSGLAAGVDVRAALDRTRARLTAAGVAADAALGEVQRTERGADQVGVPGGDFLDGVASVATWRDRNGTALPRQRRGEPRSASGLDAGGWPVNYGTSFVMSVEVGSDGPRADALLTYGNSTDPSSPHFRDQLDDFAAGRLRPVRFTEADIAADSGLVTEELSSP